MLPGEIAKTKWSKKAKEVLSWEDWWEMHEKVSPPCQAIVITRKSDKDIELWGGWAATRTNVSGAGDLYFKIVFTVWAKFTG